MHDMAARVRGTCLVSHRVHDAKQRVRERHARQTLRVVHTVARLLVPVVGIHKVFVNHLDRVQRQRIRVVAMQCRHVRLDGVRQGVHSGVGRQLWRHRLRERRVDDRHIRRDVEVGQRIFDAFVVVGNDCERRHFRRRARRGWNRDEFRLRTQCRERERRDQILEFRFRVFIERPHRLGRVDWGTAAHRDDYVRFKFLHDRRATHYRFHGRIGLDAFDQNRFHAGFLQIRLDRVQKAEALHAAAAYDDGRFRAFQRLQRFQRVFPVIQIPRQCKTIHIQFLLLLC